MLPNTLFSRASRSTYPAYCPVFFSPSLLLLRTLHSLSFLLPSLHYYTKRSKFPIKYIQTSIHPIPSQKRKRPTPPNKTHRRDLKLGSSPNPHLKSPPPSPPTPATEHPPEPHLSVQPRETQTQTREEETDDRIPADW